MKNLLFKFGIFSVILLFLDTLNLTNAANYCDPKLCTTNDVVLPHIGCNNDGKFYPDCLEPAEIKVTPSMKKVILHTHNAYRNKVANGLLPGFASAKRMTTMTWDSELEYLAELNVRTCVMKHDECHNTVAFKYSGQNCAIEHQTLPLYPPEYESVLIYLMGLWFDEYKFSNQADVDMCLRVARKHDVGHFTQMIQEKSAKLGCGISRFVKHMKGEKWDTLLLACNYSYGNLVNNSIYVKGPPCSACETGCNPEYNALCSLQESVATLPDDEVNAGVYSEQIQSLLSKGVIHLVEPGSQSYPVIQKNVQPVTDMGQPSNSCPINPLQSLLSKRLARRVTPGSQVNPLLNLQSSRLMQPVSPPQVVQQAPSAVPPRPVQLSPAPRPFSMSPPVLSVPAPRSIPTAQPYRPVSTNEVIPPLPSAPPPRFVPSGQTYRPVASGEIIPPLPSAPPPRFVPSGQTYQPVPSLRPVPAPRQLPSVQSRFPVSSGQGGSPLTPVPAPRQPPSAQRPLETVPSGCRWQPIAERSANPQIVRPYEPDPVEPEQPSLLTAPIRMVGTMIWRLFERIYPQNN